MSEEKDTTTEEKEYTPPSLNIIVGKTGEVAIDTNLSLVGATHLLGQTLQIMVEQEMQKMDDANAQAQEDNEEEDNEDAPDNVVPFDQDDKEEK